MPQGPARPHGAFGLDSGDDGVGDRVVAEGDEGLVEGHGSENLGPAVVEEEGSTLVIGPGGAGRVAASGNLIVTVA